MFREIEGSRTLWALCYTISEFANFLFILIYVLMNFEVIKMLGKNKIYHIIENISFENYIFFITE